MTGLGARLPGGRSFTTWFAAVVTAISVVLVGWFAWQQARLWRQREDAGALGIAIATAAVAAVLTWYLTNLRRFVRIDPPARDGSAPR